MGLEAVTKEQRDELIARLHQGQNNLCYVCNEVINLQVHDVDVDHIIALTNGGADNEANWGLTHAHCNRSKGARDLRLQRILHTFKKHVDSHTGIGSQGRNFTLHEALEELMPGRQEVGFNLETGCISLSWTEAGKPCTEAFAILEERSRPAARSFIGMIPFSCLHHDRETNPRSIVDLEPMIEEFYSGYPQLQPSLATLDANGVSGRGRILLFDGQHKAAAQLYAGKERLLVRVFVDYDKNRLKETNYRAHTRLAQVHFPQLINDRVGADLFQEPFGRFVRESDTTTVSESAFFKTLTKSQRTEFRKYFQNFLRYEVLTGKAGARDNEILNYTETVTARSQRYPLSYDALHHTFLSHFMFLKPAGDPLDLTEKYRMLERQNLVRLMNTFVEEVLAADRFDLKLGIYRIEDQLAANPDKIPDSHLRAYRLCRKPAMVVWTHQLARAIALLLNTKTRYVRGEWSERRPLWVEMTEEDWAQVRKMIRAIRDHKLWGERTNPDLLQAISSSKQKNWQEMINKGTLPGRHGALFPPIDQYFIFRAASGG